MTSIPKELSTSPTETFALRYLSRVRVKDILALQGPPLLGAVFALGIPQFADLPLLGLLCAGNVFLIAHTFLINDWGGITTDLADPNKAGAVFTARGIQREEMGAITIGVLILSLFLFSILGGRTVVLAAAIAALSALYSLPRFHWKARPILNSTVHFLGGILHFLLGYSLAAEIDGRGLAIAAYFALLFCAGHLTQEIRDHEGDAANGIRTNAVAFGPRRTFFASLILFTLAQTLFLALAMRGFLPRAFALLAVLYLVQLYWSREAFTAGLTFTNVSRLQNRYRALYALIGAAMVAMLCWRASFGQSANASEPTAMQCEACPSENG